ncbi:MAG: SDR family oxidoreductase [Planctomycetota bacterium]
MAAGKNTIVVTGAGSGIGRAVALELAAAGHGVVLVGRRQAPLAETAAAGGPASSVAAVDVRDGAALREALGSHGSLAGVVACAGIGGPNAPGEQDRFHELVETNLLGTYNTLRAFEPWAAPAARAVVVSSILARIGVGGYTGYCASKAGLLGLVRAFAIEWAPKGHEINAIAPGWVETDMATQGLTGMAEALGITLSQARERALGEVPLGRMSTPAEIARVIAWMLSPASRGMTGHTLDVNNGAFMA